ncbi:zinc-dependent alcohol dehydrogenase family protein [Amycolatopsis sp. CA-230715]|uniref:zinc-dependent alcohol dehydrogenase family protein n=1 Tax=Amycolatopsis sp. CA-230715 TaxID=2745196 RepID=UPI001C022AB4|nr:zinc-dependent alcohol dehydrogenase family protein [Amycolatopsis sp. CA-230715]QWF78007.1 Alcohol dehydrogenase [Amycolatopsis sp. CA-230715]
MKALVYDGPGRRRWTDRPRPEPTDATDAVVRVDAVTICGTDLHILNGDVPAVDAGRVLGHEAVGTIVETGSAVTGVKPGDRVLVSCITSCGRCQFCRQGRYGQCLGGGGWILGHRIDGVQAEFARVPFADTSTHLLPESVSDESALMLADILPTAYEVGVRNGNVDTGDTVVIVGAGPIGLAAITAARLYSPSCVIVVDKEPARLAAAKQFGADLAVEPGDAARAAVFGATEGLGADVAIEAVGVAATFELCTTLVRPGGRVANVGVHGKPATLHLEDLWIRDVTITTGLVDTVSTPRLLRMLAAGRLDTSRFVTHRFGLSEMDGAYDVFTHPGDSESLKVALFRA